jgi:hypothetical protein
MSSWTEPVVEWQAGVDSLLRHRQLVEEGELLATWPPAPFEAISTECFKVGQEYWIWQRGVGGIRFFPDRPRFIAFPSAEVDPLWFEHLVRRSWLPTVYHVWGRQVLHASAVACASSGQVVAFAGPSCVGKSTIAYGLARRPRWVPVCDDTLAFSCGDGRGGRAVRLHPLKNDARLRAATAVYYGKEGAVQEPFEWPARPLHLRAVYFLEGDPNLPCAAQFTRLKAWEGYPRLLEQAHALTLSIAKHNQQLMCDYLELAATVPLVHLAYRKTFEAIEEVLDAIENHVAKVGR